MKFENGIVYYDLIKYNEKEGTYKYLLREKEISKINSLLSAVSIDSLKENYTSYRNDMQTYNTSLLTDGTKMKVYFYDGEAPVEYQNLIDYLIGLRKNNLVKIDSIINISTRKGMELINIPIPPMPKDTMN